MLRITLWLFMGVFAWDLASCSIVCPDGNRCPDRTTCCFQMHGYGCCPYPNAVCCPDLITCCPAGFRCNMVAKRCQRENQPWLSIPLVKKEAAENLNEHPWRKPMTALTEASDSTNKDGVVRCDSKFHCSAGTTCCKGATGEWGCCPYPLGQCCADGKHCCKYGYSCDALSMTCRRFYSQVPSGAQEEAQTD